MNLLSPKLLPSDPPCACASCRRLRKACSSQFNLLRYEYTWNQSKLDWFHLISMPSATSFYAHHTTQIFVTTILRHGILGPQRSWHLSYLILPAIPTFPIYLIHFHTFPRFSRDGKRLRVTKRNKRIKALAQIGTGFRGWALLIFGEGDVAV